MYRWIFAAVGFMGLGGVLFMAFKDHMGLMILSMVFITLGILWAFAKYMEAFNDPARVFKRAQELWKSGKRTQSRKMLETIEDYRPARTALDTIEKAKR